LQFRDHRLPNGLEIIAECNPDAYSAAIGFFVNTGSRDENPELAGVSHFLEHMAFKGTPTRTAADVNRELDEIGSHANAFTSEEQTVYYAAVLPEWQGRAVDILSDILRPSLRDDDFELEKQVILEEIAKYDDQPPFGAGEKCMAMHFGSHPLGQSVLGTADSVGALTPALMREYFERRYSPANIALVAAGNVDFDALVADARQRCGDWPCLPVQRTMAPVSASLGFEVISRATAAQQYVVQIADGPAIEDKDRYAGRLLATILGDESGSRFFWELVDTGLAECASITPYEFQRAGVFMTFLCCAPEDTEQNLERMYDILHEAERHGVTDAELTRAKSKVCSQVVLQGERPSNRLFSVGGSWIARREYRTVRDAVESYRAVTVAQIHELVRQYSLTRCTTVAVGPLPALNPGRFAPPRT
jgi:predicted Zn-dependent peptidase